MALVDSKPDIALFEDLLLVVVFALLTTVSLHSLNCPFLNFVVLTTLDGFALLLKLDLLSLLIQSLVSLMQEPLIYVRCLLLPFKRLLLITLV